jgi:hypothetical protein
MLTHFHDSLGQPLIIILLLRIPQNLPSLPIQISQRSKRNYYPRGQPEEQRSQPGPSLNVLKVQSQYGLPLVNTTRDSTNEQLVTHQLVTALRLS